MQGVTYGPLCPRGDPPEYLGTPEIAARDFDLIRRAGFNLLRVYHVPPRWFMDLAREKGLRVIITVPWQNRVLFLNDGKARRTIRRSVRDAARAHPGHPALMGFYVDNEIPADLVRWYGARRVETFLDSLAQIVKSEDDGALVAYANFPPTEYLLPKFVDFYSYNVYLHDPEVLSNYLARLQNLAEDKPLVLGEFGMDTFRHSEEEQARLLEAHYSAVFRAGAAGTIIFAWTDEWFTNGIEVEDWAFGLVRRDRTPKLAYERIQSKIIPLGGSVVEKYPLPETPKVSVVVCSYNGAATLRECLQSLHQLNYPDYEVILVDDGSKDNTGAIAKDFPWVRYIKQPNLGLSVARNTGIAASEGSVVAFTDSDCMADKDWLYYLVQTLTTGNWAAVGGPNISPPARDWIQASVAASPGSPSHVLLTDREAEHVPGCNMAYYKWALEMIDGFDPEYRKAGDDVDVCWRIMQRGFKIGFSPAALVWHHRRFTVRTYFKQQSGYGEAEALLRFKHLNYFDSSGSARWRGTIYGQPRGEFSLAREVVYHGVFGTGFFQTLYRGPQPGWIGLVGGLEWVGLSLIVLFISWQVPEIRMVPLVMVGATLLAAMLQMATARLEPRFDSVLSRLLVFYLALAQPLVRGWARYFTWLREKRTPTSVALSKEELPHEPPAFLRSSSVQFWSEQGKVREHLLEEAERLLSKEGWKYTLDTGWSNWDIQIFANRWWHLRVRTLTEIYPHGRRLTRAGIHLSPSTFSLVSWGLAMTASTIFSLAYPILLVLVVPIVGVALLYWLATGYALRFRIASLLSAAATRAGMVPVKSRKG
ncbi:MAG: hypothetical protein OHK005_10140 [Candidatus Methylacidiphilales bacterium]